mgnify:CR=1 FL=1
MKVRSCSKYVRYKVVVSARVRVRAGYANQRIGASGD